jgi:eukaryotic-like serine/threonine-protein kinase
VEHGEGLALPLFGTAMNTVRRGELKSRWKDLSELPNEAHAAYLESLRRDDAEMANELLSLLDANEKSGDFLEKGFAPSLPQRFGSWRPIRQLGQGGMGQVFHAVRAVGDFEQQAAIKTLRADLLTPEAVRRFQRERRILARLDHPNIARLLDGGEDDPAQPYLAMEFVEGASIDQWAEGKALDEKLALFQQVCGAVSYAHQHLVVHCDLKPSNILVNANGQVKLLDFGIARLLSPDLDTATAQHLTPHYASPEQLRNQPLSTASDIYSLGVVLYKILSGKLPYASTTSRNADPVELARDICDSPALELGPDFPRDLRAVAAKALAKVPQDRYPSAQALGRDIANFQAGKSVEAHPLSPWREAARLLSRHRFTTAAAVLGLIALLVATGWALSERNRAQRLLLESREMSGSLIWEVEKALRQETPTEARKILLERTGEHLNRLAQTGSLDRSLAVELAESYRLLADARRDRNNADARSDYARALAMLEPWRGQPQADFVRAKVLMDSRDKEKIEEALRILAALEKRTDEIRRSLWTSAASIAHEAYGVNHASQGRYEDTRQEWTLGLELARESQRLEPREAAESQVARMFRRMSAISTQLKDYESALRFQRESIANEEAAHAKRPGQATASNLATSYSEAALALRNLKRPGEALDYIGRSAALRRKLYENDSNNEYLKFALSNSLAMQGSLLQELGKLKDAGPLIGEAARIASTMNDGGLHHAQVLSYLAEWEAAQPALRVRALEHRKQALAYIEALRAKGKFPAYKANLYEGLAAHVKAAQK